LDITLRTAAIAGGLLVALLAAGCGTQPVTQRQTTVQGCADYGVYAIDHHITVTRMPAACQGLSKAQINEAAASAINMAVGGRSKKPAWRRLTAEVAPRLAYLITGPQPGPSSPPQTYQPAGGTPVRQSTGGDLPLSLAALGAWLITAGSGAYLLGSWIISSGIRRKRTPPAGAPPAVLLGHFGLAATGLVVWVIYLIADWTPLAWTAVGLLLPITGLGLAMATLGLPSSSSGPLDVPARAGTAATPARGWVLVPLVAGHGLLAAATLILVVLAAIGTGAG
jgi:hypothetical protein